MKDLSVIIAAKIYFERSLTTGKRNGMVWRGRHREEIFRESRREGNLHCLTGAVSALQAIVKRDKS